MKKLTTILFILLSISIQAQFTAVQTKLLSHNNYPVSHIFTSFEQPADNGIYKSFASANNVLAVQENVFDARVLNGAIVRAQGSVAPLMQGNVLTSQISFLNLMRSVEGVEGTQTFFSVKLLYELRNDGPVAADLHFGFNPRIRYMSADNFHPASGFYRIKMYRALDDAGSPAANSEIFDSGDMRAAMNNNIRGIAYENVPPGETRYVVVRVRTASYTEGRPKAFVLIDASQGLSVGFDNEAIPMSDGLDNDPFIDVKAKLKFQLHNLFADPNNGPAMGLTGATAFTEFKWLNGISDAYGIAENTGILENVDGITVKMDEFELVDFDPMDVLNAGWGSAGDRRTYINGVAKIYKDGVLKMQVDDCRIALNINYPAPLGTGLATTGGGWGRISTLNTDPAWFAEFDENHTQQVEFVFHSLSYVVNNPFYDAVIAIVPTEYRDDYVGWQVGAGGGIVENVDSVGISMNFRNVGEAGSAYARLLSTNPGGALPDGVTSISTERFWELGATFSSFTADIDFDLAGVSGITDMSKIRILHREVANDVWTVLDPVTYTVDGNRIRVAGISDFSQFGIGSTNGTLPVELTSFTAAETNGNVLLNWTTATEVNNYGFEIQRTSAELSSNTEFGRGAEGWIVIGFVEGHGNSNSLQEYSFIDVTVAERSRSYRLKQIDNDGGYEYSDIVTVSNSLSKTELHQNHPNPFNPSTQISFTLSNSSNVNVSVYNALGQKVAELLNENMNAGSHDVEFNANNFASGFYFYRLETPNYSKTMKMLLLK